VPTFHTVSQTRRQTDSSYYHYYRPTEPQQWTIRLTVRAV